MDMLSSPKAKALLVVVIGVATAIHLSIQWHDAQNGSVPRITGNLPPAAYLEYHPNGIPGNPAYTVAQMHQLYRALQTYTRRTGLSGVDDFNAFLNDVVQNHKDYGLANLAAVRALITNPDSAYDDLASARIGASEFFPYMMLSIRPDGSKAGGTVPPGTKDVLMYTNLYFHRNTRWSADKKRAKQYPVGFYLVLWSDGSVTQVPYDQSLFVKQGSNNWVTAFRGQAGVPAGALPYWTYFNTP